ncbi:serine/threonine kinase [Spathaspora passalidarum NRRL Y-27907]|uniref:non-specific serine/threonine protein kinase n=1 Tax=Spathaspora passalidarum (strain NRRL Y-27907 / 11-Y1) TaxID=619300 RepID=G3AV84_SPAPN|nr:serine/threonine kinase [Spathaspora passalidarum NRRL Y-27907]EGW29887.1 serine/threonine kinase [Spathaspora passalidarum NRRL Y-27907]
MQSTVSTASSTYSVSTKPHPKFSRQDARLMALGDGVSGFVELFQHKSGFLYAVKTYHCKETYESRSEYKTRVLYEYHLLAKLDHRNIIKVFKYDVSLSGNTVKFYMDAGSANLAQLIRVIPKHKYNQNEMLCIWRQIVAGVNYLHDRGICHRDLKLENVVFDIDHFQIKIIDFATADEKEVCIGIVGSEIYLAPETYTSIKYHGTKVDVWSVGIILFYLWNRKFPWKSARWNDPEYKEFHAESARPESDQASTTIHLKQSVLQHLPVASHALTSQIFECNPETRSSIADFYKDTWFTSIGFCDGVNLCGIDHHINFNPDKVKV